MIQLVCDAPWCALTCLLWLLSYNCTYMLKCLWCFIFYAPCSTDRKEEVEEEEAVFDALDARLHGESTSMARFLERCKFLSCCYMIQQVREQTISAMIFTFLACIEHIKFVSE